jgi:hemerythrin-like metal-binding protein
VESLDFQHKKMLGIIGKLGNDHEASGESELVSDVLKDIHRYADEHFQYEERLLDEDGCELLEEQRKQHRYFTKKITEYAADIANNGEETIINIHEFLKVWWIKHILIWDMKYKGILKERTGKTTVACPKSS